MSEHLLDGISHDDGRGGGPLFARQVHAGEPMARSAVMSSRSGVGVPAGVSGASGRGTVGTAAPTRRLSPIVRATSYAYTTVAVIVAVFAFVLAPWGLLLLIVTLAALAVAVLLRLMAAGLAAIEEDES